MHYYRDLYLDDKTKRDRIKILRKIKYHAGLFKTVVISVSEGRDYFDLIPGFVFKQKSYPKDDMLILGLASDEQSAQELAIKAFSDFTERYGTCFFKEELLKEKENLFSGFRGRKP